MKKTIKILFLLTLFITNVKGQIIKMQELISKGVQLHDKGDFKGAIELYKQALEIDKKSPLANYEISSTYFSLKDYEKAIEFSDKVIDLDKEYVDQAYLLKGTALDMIGNSKDAIQTYKKAIKKYSDNYLLYYNLALTSYNLSDYKTAEEALQKSIKLKPTHGSSHLLLGYVMNDQGSRVKSLLALYNFLLIDPESKRSESAFQLLEALLKKGVSKGDDKTITISLSKGQDSEFSAADLMLSILESSKNLEENKGKSDHELFTENTSSFFSVVGELNDKKKDFWWTYYVDFFYSMKTNNHIEAFCYYISQSKNDRTINTWIENNKTKVDSLTQWSSNYKRKI